MKDCKYTGCSWEEIITGKLWLNLIKQGQAEDLGRGGLWDARPGCINLWVSSKDKPPGWGKARIPRTRLPRSYIAGFFGELRDIKDMAVGRPVIIGRLPEITWEIQGQAAIIHLVITPYARAELVGRRALDKITVEENGRQVQKHVHELATEEERAWCLDKWARLKAKARERE